MPVVVEAGRRAVKPRPRLGARAPWRTREMTGWH
jgi:hypothetical protein